MRKGSERYLDEYIKPNPTPMKRIYWFLYRDHPTCFFRAAMVVLLLCVINDTALKLGAVALYFAVLLQMIGNQKGWGREPKRSGCPYCNFGESDVGERMNNCGDNFVLIKNSTGAAIATDDKRFVMLDIKFCPVCGRNLEVKE